MTVLPSRVVYEGDTLTVSCTVVDSLKDVEVYLIKGESILARARNSLTRQIQVLKGDSGLVCKSEWGNVQNESNTSITVKGRK